MNVAAYPKYDSYIESNVGWIKEVPAAWRVLRIQDFATFNNDVVNESDYRTRRIKYVDISGVDSSSNTYSYEEQDFTAAPSRARRLAICGDTVFSTVRPYLKAVATIEGPEDDLVFSTGFAVIRPKRNVDPRFVGYMLRNERFVNEVTANSVGASYPAINATDLVKLHTPLPPLPEQRAIAAFLDVKCATIDEAVWIREAQIKLLRERRQILIQQAVTRGLNPDAPMKDSGIDWIGEIPAHWESVPLKRLFTERNERTKTGQETLLSLRMVEGLVPHDDVSDKLISDEALVNYKKVYPGQMVMNRMRASIGLFGVVDQLGLVSPDYAVFDMQSDVFGPFYLYLFKMEEVGARFRLSSKGLGTGSSGFMRLYTDDFGAISVPVPPFEEQQEIVSYIGETSKKLNEAISLKQSQIDRFKEYKTTLINAAVTGKIKVS